MWAALCPVVALFTLALPFQHGIFKVAAFVCLKEGGIWGEGESFGLSWPWQVSLPVTSHCPNSVVSLGRWERELSRVPRQEQAQGVCVREYSNLVKLDSPSCMFQRAPENHCPDPHRKVVIVLIVQMRKWGFRKLK